MPPAPILPSPRRVFLHPPCGARCTPGRLSGGKSLRAAPPSLQRRRCDHAASGRRSRTSDKASYGLLAIRLDPFGGFFFCAAADFADHYDAGGFRVSVEKFDYVKVRGAVDRIAANADAGALADAARRELPHGFISQRAAARDDTDVAFFVNVAGRNTNTATAVRIFTFARRHDARTIRSNQPRLEIAFQCPFHTHHVAHGNAFRDGDNEFESGVRAFENRIRSERRRHENRTRGRARLFHSIGDGVENRHFLAAVLEELTALAGRDTGDDLRAVVNRELRVLGAEAAGDALDENLGIGFD